MKIGTLFVFTIFGTLIDCTAEHFDESLPREAKQALAEIRALLKDVAGKL